MPRFWNWLAVLNRAVMSRAARVAPAGVQTGDGHKTRLGRCVNMPLEKKMACRGSRQAIFIMDVATPLVGPAYREGQPFVASRSTAMGPRPSR